MVGGGRDGIEARFREMSLANQISLITIPQEFTRLCNAVLRAEHGDDFLPIDDDQADGGNDGYLRSERRMFAAHCFKRIQNQGVEAKIKEKMVGDLGKAIALKQAGIWEIETWTFLCNYPISEAIAEIVVPIGAEAGIAASWRGSDFLAEALQRHPEAREQFPGLNVTEIGGQLIALQASVDKLAGEGDSAAGPVGVPRSAAELERVRRHHPPGWEFLLFAGVLLLGKERLETRWHDLEMPPYSVQRHSLDPEGATRLNDSVIQGMLGLIEALNRVFEPEAHEMAFGAVGEPGNAGRIEHFGERVIQTYEGMMDLVESLRDADVPPMFDDLFEAAIRLPNQPLSEIRSFIDDVVLETEKVPAFVADPDPDKKLLHVKATLTLTIDPVVSGEYLAALAALKSPS